MATNFNNVYSAACTSSLRKIYQIELKFGDNDTISVVDLNAVFEGCIPALMAG